MKSRLITKESHVLKEIPLFSCLGENEIEVLESASREMCFPKNAVIINEGDETSNLYVVLEGCANAISIDLNGRQIILNVFKPGDYFGEMSFIDEEPRCATVITKEKSKFAIIRWSDFRTIALDNPELMLNIMKGLIRKIRVATKQIEDLAFRDVYGRIARLLTELENEEGLIPDKLTNTEIAFRVGSSREMASRIITELKNGGFITRHCGRIKINKKLPYNF